MSRETFHISAETPGGKSRTDSACPGYPVQSSFIRYLVDHIRVMGTLLNSITLIVHINSNIVKVYFKIIVFYIVFLYFKYNVFKTVVLLIIFVETIGEVKVKVKVKKKEKKSKIRNL